MSDNSNLRLAKKVKDDEFYTRMSDVEKEMEYYGEYFKDSVIYCNCDDPEWSGFWRYFHLNFGFLGLKKLIATHYHRSEPTYKMEYDGGNDDDVSAGQKTPLKSNGDFRSHECIDLLKQADIVVTNPPFSLWREYISQLMEYGKKFIIIGHQTVVVNRDVFRWFTGGKIWFGHFAGNMSFRVPDDRPPVKQDFG